MKTGQFDKEILQNTIEFGENMLRFIGDIGGEFMVLGSPKQRSLPEGAEYVDGKNFLLQYLARMLDVQEKCGLSVYLDPMGPEDTNFINDDEEVLDMLDRFNLPRYYAMVLGVEAMSEVGDPVKIIKSNKECIDHLRHIHVQEANKKASGQGTTPILSVLSALKELGYDRWISEKHMIYQPNPVGLAGRACKYLNYCNNSVNLWG